jgi:hypothetical protein
MDLFILVWFSCTLMVHLHLPSCASCQRPDGSFDQSQLSRRSRICNLCSANGEPFGQYRDMYTKLRVWDTSDDFDSVIYLDADMIGAAV